MSGLEAALVFAAGFACGVVNAIAGGGSLILFPALAATGMGTLSANVTNSVATWPGYLGSVWGFRKELEGKHRFLMPLAMATVVGSVIGCWLLLSTSTEMFDQIVPVLVLAAGALVAVQPRLSARVAAGEGRSRRAKIVQLIAIGAAAVYGGYFGAALGVIFLGVLGLTVGGSLRELNALKAALSLIDATVSVVAFSAFGPVRWGAVLVAAPAALIGGYVGARLARRIDPDLLRILVVGFSVLVAVALFAT
ncbi:MAG: sulfite exporter TauE/SafE family protein [Acidimicrobiales bacterium]|nr:sulfite exporter TauE/SafE family protein [Acidimicrobiales bacterium]